MHKATGLWAHVASEPPELQGYKSRVAFGLNEPHEDSSAPKPHTLCFKLPEVMKNVMFYRAL